MTENKPSTRRFRDPSLRIELVAREPRIPREFLGPMLLVAACLAFGLWRLIF